MPYLGSSRRRRLPGTAVGNFNVSLGSTCADWLAHLSGSKQSSESSSIGADAPCAAIGEERSVVNGSYQRSAFVPRLSGSRTRLVWARHALTRNDHSHSSRATPPRGLGSPSMDQQVS